MNNVTLHLSLSFYLRSGDCECKTPTLWRKRSVIRLVLKQAYVMWALNYIHTLLKATFSVRRGLRGASTCQCTRTVPSRYWFRCLGQRQMNSDSVVITRVHAALHTHAVFNINKQPCSHLPRSSTKIELTLHIQRLLATNHRNP